MHELIIMWGQICIRQTENCTNAMFYGYFSNTSSTSRVSYGKPRDAERDKFYSIYANALKFNEQPLEEYI